MLPYNLFFRSVCGLWLETDGCISGARTSYSSLYSPSSSHIELGETSTCRHPGRTRSDSTSAHAPEAPSSDCLAMHVTRAASLVMAALLGGKATALHAQHPFLSSELEGAASALTIVPLHGRAGKGLLPPYMENGAILSRESLLSLPDLESQNDVEVAPSSPNTLAT